MDTAPAFPIDPDPDNANHVAALVDAAGVSPARAKALLAVAAGVAPNGVSAAAAVTADLLVERATLRRASDTSPPSFDLTDEGRRLVARGLREWAINRAVCRMTSAIGFGVDPSTPTAAQAFEAAIASLRRLDTPAIARVLEVAPLRAVGPQGAGTAFAAGVDLYAARPDAPRVFGRAWPQAADGDEGRKGYGLKQDGKPQAFDVGYAARLAAAGRAFEVAVEVAGVFRVVATVRPWGDHGFRPEFADVEGACDGMAWNSPAGDSVFRAGSPASPGRLWFACSDARCGGDAFGTFDQAVDACMTWRTEARLYPLDRVQVQIGDVAIEPERAVAEAMVADMVAGVADMIRDPDNAPPEGWRWKADGHNTIERDDPYAYAGINERGNVFVHGVTFNRSIQGRGATVVDADTARAIAFLVRFQN